MSGASNLPKDVRERTSSHGGEVEDRGFIEKECVRKTSEASNLPRGWRDRAFSLRVQHSGRKSSIEKTAFKTNCEGSIMFDEEFNTLDESKLRGMMKLHYIDKTDRKSCTGCNRKFTLKKRARHCRRCGEVFCIKCLRNKMSLNRLAHPDPAGKPRKVCLKCFEEDVGILGCTSNWTAEFIDERKFAKLARVLSHRVESLTTTFWRDQLDIPKECKRLLIGFEKSLGDSGSTLQQTIQGLVKPPEWQQPSSWQVEKLSESCRVCKGNLGVRKSKRNCKICGLAICKKCSLAELLIYYDDQCPDDKREAKLTVINVRGCPDTEPTVSLLLCVCVGCKTDICDRQVLNPSWLFEARRQDGPLDDLVWMDDIFSQLQGAITTALYKCEQCADVSDGNGKHKETSEESLSKTLTKLGKYLDEYEEHFKKLKAFLARTQSKTQKVFVQNYTKSKYDFFMENKHTYRRLCKQSRSVKQ